MRADFDRQSAFGRDVVARLPVRFVARGRRPLTFDNIQGPWRPSGTVAGIGVFAVVWTTARHEFWAPLHDFEPADQLRLIEACKRLDQAASGLGGHGA